MFLTDPLFFAVAIPAAIFAGISKAGFGSGASFVSAAALALVMDPGLALGIMLPLLMLIDVAAIPSYWRKWDAPVVRGLVIGAVPGVALAALLYTAVDDDAIRLLIGVICLAFVGYQWARSSGMLRIGNFRFTRPWAWIAGATAGFTSFVSHAGGPPVAVFTLGLGMDKTRYQATSIITFWAINILKFGPYAYLGIFTGQTLLADLILAPFALLGTYLGVRAHRMVSERLFFGLTYVLLVVTGLRLVWIALA